MGFIIILSNGGAKGGKERLLFQFLEAIKLQWNLKPSFTLSDKDISEIRALVSVFPEAKHQLCYWHALRAIKTRLSILRRTPGFYDVKEACAEFPEIDPSFVPIGQIGAENLVCLN